MLKGMFPLKTGDWVLFLPQVRTKLHLDFRKV